MFWQTADDVEMVMFMLPCLAFHPDRRANAIQTLLLAFAIRCCRTFTLTAGVF